MSTQVPDMKSEVFMAVNNQGLLGCDNPEDLDLNVYRSY